MSDGLENLRQNWKILVALLIVAVAWGEMRVRVANLEDNKGWNINQSKDIKDLDRRVTRLEAKTEYLEGM